MGTCAWRPASVYGWAGSSQTRSAGPSSTIRLRYITRIDSLDEKRQHQLIDNFFSQVPAGVSELKGEMAEITSALPLTDAEKQAAIKTLGISDVQFKVDPSILGGLVVRVGDRVVDDSVSNRMSALQESLRR